MEPVEYVFVEHFVPACLAALWFAGGSMFAFPAARWDPGWLRKTCFWLLGRVMRLFGRRPGMARTAATIFAFNGVAIFLYMSSGVRRGIPAGIAFMTGFFLSFVFLRASEFEVRFDVHLPSSKGRAPGPALVLVCTAATILLELTCFWYALGMGIRLGESLVANQGGYRELMLERALAYCTVLLPVLLLSAVCESIAIRGARTLGAPGDVE